MGELGASGDILGVGGVCVVCGGGAVCVWSEVVVLEVFFFHGSRRAEDAAQLL